MSPITHGRSQRQKIPSRGWPRDWIQHPARAVVGWYIIVEQSRAPEARTAPACTASVVGSQRPPVVRAPHRAGRVEHYGGEGRQLLYLVPPGQGLVASHKGTLPANSRARLSCFPAFNGLQQQKLFSRSSSMRHSYHYPVVRPWIDHVANNSGQQHTHARHASTSSVSSTSSWYLTPPQKEDSTRARLQQERIALQKNEHHHAVIVSQKIPGLKTSAGGFLPDCA